MAISARLVGFAVLCCWSVGCAAQKRVDLTAHTGGSAFLFKQFQAFDGTTGRPLRFADIVRRCRHADVVLLGEQHGNAICNQLEAQLLHALLDTGRPLMLAMEFFEADTQTTLDAYLTGKIDEADFLEQTKRPASYLNSHRPLIELSQAARLPVTAANAPRRLVTDYRKSGLSYEDYRAGLEAEQ
ncbi:MAG: ChaN family lipoprotein, partial [Phycisphaerae bacterium]